MFSHVQVFINIHKWEMTRTEDTKLRRHLNTDTRSKTMRTGFAGSSEPL